MRPLPRAPLFPYTTLFRSLAARLLPQARHVVGVGQEARVQHQVGVRGEPELEAEGEQAEMGARASVEAEDLAQAGPDRKSTRLNSSHVESSYAVFCLKKKK